MPIKISAVSYLNTIPFLYGLKYSAVKNDIQLNLATPTDCAQHLEVGKADVALVPVAALPNIPNYNFTGDYCIGATGAVRSVVLLSNLPLSEIKEIYLDSESRTSVLLVQLLAKHFWKISPQFTSFSPTALAKGEACVLIGDKVFTHESKYIFRYDLAEEWIQFTGKPFVFAAWACTRTLSNSFIRKFNAALRYGITHIPQAIEIEGKAFEYEMALQYLTKHISYSFDALKHEGMQLFWKLAAENAK